MIVYTCKKRASTEVRFSMFYACRHNQLIGMNRFYGHTGEAYNGAKRVIIFDGNSITTFSIGIGITLFNLMGLFFIVFQVFVI